MGSYNGSGTFVRSYSWQTDAANGIKIRADRMDTEDDGFATNGLSLCVTRDGQSPATANLPMAGFKHTGVGVATAADQYVSAGQLQNGGLTYSAVTGTDTYAASPTPAVIAYTDGLELDLHFANANLTNAPTLNVSAVGAKALTDAGGNALVIGQIGAGLDTIARYNAGADKFRLLSYLPRLVGLQVFTSTGTYTPSAGMRSCLVILTAGGGGGESAASSQGGGAGETAIGVFTSTDIGASKAVTIGAGGATDASGSVTSLGALLTAAGGATGGLSSQNGGAGGTGTGLHITGGDGASGFNSTTSPRGGAGGGSFWGGGSPDTLSPTAVGAPGRAYGAGGAGSGLASNGGAGAKGVLIVLEF